MVSIHHRPTHIEDQTEIGHLEGDLVMGSRPSADATLVDRKARYVRLVNLPSSFGELPLEQRLSLT
ncbi:IS30 family transposase [Arthrobacter pigmenti]|uniref:IS30 family transposase n=1 Tax=Arthrobacter pigmenti TaxID=271432 RepID=A0A846RDN6_9MICC|nr:IS30 family transposase [Arthrobacter pigmenti]